MAVNTFGANGLLSRHTSGGSVFYAFDFQSSVAQRADATGAALSADRYDAFGGRASKASQSDPWGFGAQWGAYTDSNTK